MAKSPKKQPTSGQPDICKQALGRYQRWLERERQNVNAAYEDLEFTWNDAQWPAEAARSRKGRPMLTVNRLPQFVHQVTGDMRQMRPAIKVVPVDSAGDKETAETIAGMVRYIENRSDASAIYTAGADSQVSCGIGAWQVVNEYAGESTLNQECRIIGVSDAVAIAWDPDAILPTREDAKWCIVPVDMSREAFKEAYPKASLDDFDTLKTPMTGEVWSSWFDNDFIRIAVYWCKEPMQREVALMPDGVMVDLTRQKDEAKVAQFKALATKVEMRPSFQLKRYLITAAQVLEEQDWPGMYIPIVPVIGEEVRIGRKVVRRGLVRAAKDPQKMLNYFCSAQAEVVALQPKAPFMATQKNVENFREQYEQANRENLPYLLFDPDPLTSGAAPQRVQPPVSSQGISEGIALATENMKAVIGIYDASLGAKSNETSGIAIEKRQKEGDTGSYVYIDNWTRGIRHTGQILIDLFRYIYDTERMIRIMGDDSKVDLKEINKPQGVTEHDVNGKMMQLERIKNDLTIGSYDVVLETGPSYTTKREEARGAMSEFIRSAPDIAPAVLDLVAKAQDWPLADEFAKRLEVIAPPPVQKLIAQQKKESNDEEKPIPPTQDELLQKELMQRGAAAEVLLKEAQVEKTKAEAAKIGQEAAAGPEQPQADPLVPEKLKGEQQRQQIEADTAVLELKGAERKAAHEEKMEAIELEIQLVKLAQAKATGMVDTASAVLDIKGQQAGLERDAESHAATLVQTGQSIAQTEQGMTHSEESHQANLESQKASDKLAATKAKAKPKP